MRHVVAPLWGEKVGRLRQTKRALTPQGELVVFVQFLRKVELLDVMGKHLPFAWTPPNAIDPVQTFTAFLASVLTGL